MITLYNTLLVSASKVHELNKAELPANSTLHCSSGLRLSRVERPTKHIIGHFGDGFLRVK